jgi:hypothetical protein
MPRDRLNRVRRMWSIDMKEDIQGMQQGLLGENL